MQVHSRHLSSLRAFCASSRLPYYNTGYNTAKQLARQQPVSILSFKSIVHIQYWLDFTLQLECWQPVNNVSYNLTMQIQ